MTHCGNLSVMPVNHCSNLGVMPVAHCSNLECDAYESL